MQAMARLLSMIGLLLSESWKPVYIYFITISRRKGLEWGFSNTA